MQPSFRPPAAARRASFDRLDRRITMIPAAVAIPVLRIALGRRLLAEPELMAHTARVSTLRNEMAS